MVYRVHNMTKRALRCQVALGVVHNVWLQVECTQLLIVSVYINAVAKLINKFTR